MAAPSSAPCTSAHVGDPATPGVRMIIGGYDIRFPFKPYASQIGIASRVLKALDTGTNALLESPTGSGKSLALLCAALAWQERWKQDRENGGDVDETQGEHRDNGEQTNDPSTSSRDTTTKHDKKEAKQTKKVPRVYYATRTHSQIAQVVRELKRTSYRPLMTVLGSREHYCVNQKARTAAKKKGGNLGEECKSLLDAGGRGGRGGVRLGETDDDDQSNASKKTKGCGFSHGALKLASSVSKQNQDPVDIEDLVALGVKNKACPYFAAKQMQTTAELVFCPCTCFSAFPNFRLDCLPILVPEGSITSADCPPPVITQYILSHKTDTFLFTRKTTTSWTRRCEARWTSTSPGR